MIQSFVHKKNLNVKYEDTITSTIIGTLLYLPDQQLWQVLREACSENSQLPEDPGALELYSFWPKWDPTGTTNSNHVEPDVFLRFSNLDLVFEAKRFDESGQNRKEWKQEFIAYKNEYGKDNQPVFLIALGGNGNNMQNENEQIKKHTMTVVKCSWANLYNACLKRQKTFSGNSKRVIDSIITISKKLGIRSYHWLDEKQWLTNYVIHAPENYYGLRRRSQIHG